MVSDKEELENLRRKKRILKRNLRNQFIGTPEDVKRKISEVEDLGVDKMVISVEKTTIEEPLKVIRKELM